MHSIVEMLADVPEVEVNLPDKEGNTPLIFAAQAGKDTCNQNCFLLLSVSFA